MKKHCNVNGSDSINPDRKTNLNDGGEKKVIKFRPQDTPGVICIERHVQDEAVVISGSLIFKRVTADLDAWIEEEISNAANEVRNRGGVIGQIKTALTATSTSVIKVSDEKPMEKEPLRKEVRIILAAIIHKLEPKEAEDIIRKALAGFRTHMRE